jgi:hypothetical protein
VVSHSHNLLRSRCKLNLIPPQRCHGTHRPHRSMGRLKNPGRQWQPSRNTLSINLQKNGLRQQEAQRTDEAPLWLRRQKNQARQSNNITRLVWHPQNSTHRIHNLQCCRHDISFNAIFGRGLLNIFETTLHSAFLCLKVPTTFDVITVFGNQKEARNIERGFILGHKNVHFLREDADQPEQPSSKQEISAEFKKAIEAESDFTRVALDPRILGKTMCIGVEMSP